MLGALPLKQLLHLYPKPENMAMTLHRTRAIKQLQVKILDGDFDDVLLQCVMSMILADVCVDLDSGDPHLMLNTVYSTKL